MKCKKEPVTFKIIESDWTKDFNELYEQIKIDITNGMSISKIKAKYGLTDGKWQTYRKQLLKDGLATKNKDKPEPRYYSAYRGGYVVQKVINHHKYHIGSFKSESDAKLCVKLMKECNWDLTRKNEIVNKIRSETNAKK